MKNEMDMNAGLILTGEKSIDEIGEMAYEKLIATLNGELTKSEAIRYFNSIDIHCLGPVI
jgi:altronate dehydratase large subunit